MSKLFKSRKISSKKESSKKKSKESKLNSIKNRTSHWDFVKITKFMVGFAVILAIITSYFWYNQLYMTPERRFWLSINNSMATPSVVRTLTEGGSGNQVVQNYRFNFAPQRSVQNKVTYTEKSATTDTTVVTEGIIFPTEQYLRYTEFSNNRTDNQTAGNIDEVLGEWASSNNEDSEQSKLNYLSEQVSLVIFGNYGANFRNELINDMKNQQVYGPNLNDAIADKVDGNDVYVYNVSVKLKAYAEMLNNAFVEAGFGEFPPLNPDNYREDSLVNAVIIVDKKNNSIVSVNFGGRDERYENYGVNVQLEKPDATKTVEELQQKVQQLLQANF